MHRTIRAALVATLAAWSCAAAAQDTLSMPEVKSLISGNTAYMQNLESKVYLRMHFAPSGTFTVLRDDGAQFDGVWSVRADGTLCTIASNENCGKLHKNADGTYTRDTGAGGFAHRWLKFTPGKDF
jgi:hypothetical protein